MGLVEDVHMEMFAHMHHRLLSVHQASMDYMTIMT